MRYGSVCSGIEAASKAWEPLGWKPAWFSEIEPFPSAVLAHHWPEVTNLGDMTKIADAVRAGEVEATDVLVGGTPCQAFSIAGLREGLSDDRGQLTLSYVELANAIDAKRRERGEPEAIIVWGNVPGVLSSKDNAFGCFLAGLAGESSELQPAGGKWTHAGCVSGPERVIAWRVLDAQFFGVAQRRRRVFVVASARKGFDPAEVLFEFDSVRRINPPSKQTPVPVCLTARGAGSLDDRETYIVTPERRIRHLMPIENERQMGFPDNHTQIPWRGKASADCPDGPRYKAIGNSMAVPVMRWIGERIAAELPIEEPTPRSWQRPFLKWAGGKYSLLPELDRLIPAGKRLIEPFVGGGSVFLNSDKHERFLLADVNADLINLYQMLAVVPDSVIYEAMKAFRHLNDAENYTEIREAFNAQRLDAVERAAAFLYLNRHCFNGLIRYNLDGFFNVGFGKYKAPYFPEEEIKAFKRKAHSCVFMNAGFRRTLTLAGDGDVVYCDPPYEPLPGTAGFTNYAAGGFSWDSQVELTESCVAAHQRGAKVAISNSTAPRVIELYEQHGFTLHRVSARRAISSKGSTRETASDVVATLGVQ
ncbi:Dam family site-specific DNA-(adenine-N6)-methyltransferase [Salmonella enterica subsp. enterica]|nr:Dam family site-specific DNA-(adenine-N6)-methyltransferase [Salmonella enterica subsp. enterica]EEA8717045.1 Dam family site-specific DNA-(adenine-N6)-methyltransferase [Salmonella enterica subsp. enterica serovar Lexington]